MKNRSNRKSLPIVCFLATGLCTGQVIADWSGDKLYGGYNQRYGNFPPMDIDKQLSDNSVTDNEPEESLSQTDNAPVSSSSNQPFPTSNQQALNPAQNYSEQNFQQPAYGSYNRGRKSTSPGRERYNRRSGSGSGFGMPWDNNRSGFSGPWDNRGSGFSAPWDNSRSSFGGPRDNRGSGFSGPWDNNRSSFGGPWDNRGSGFSGPWDNNNSSFSMPWGNNNGSGWGW